MSQTSSKGPIPAQWDLVDLRTKTARDLDAEYERRGYEILFEYDETGHPLAANSGTTVPGIRITPESAMLSTVVCACVRVISESVASLPLHLVRHAATGGKARETSHPLYRLLHTAPNDRHSSFWFRELMTSWCALYGNAYAEIVRVRGQIRSIVPLHPSRMICERLQDGKVRYRYNEPTGETTYYAQGQIFHLPWMSADGMIGMMPVGLARDAIMLARACDIYGVGFFANSARPSVVLETEHSIPPEAQERLREAWERVHRGPAQAGKTAILPNGLKAHELGQTNHDNQYHELRQFQISEIARVWRVPPHLVGDLSRATFSNIESQGLDFLNYCLLPWLRRWESAIEMAMLQDEQDLRAEFDTRGLMRADSATRATYIQTCINLGLYSINEARDLEGLPPVENGDVRFVTLNVQTLDAAIKAAQSPPQPGAAPAGPAGPEPGDDEGPAEDAVPGDKEADAKPKPKAAKKKPAKRSRPKAAAEGRNCGDGAGGFQPGNTCAKGGEGAPSAFPETKDAAAFLSARDKSSRPVMFSDFTHDSLASMEMHLSADGKVGYLLSPEKHLGNVFNNGGPKGAGSLAVLDAIKNGAQTLDCYDPVLPTIYSRCGFVPTARIKFNDEYAPKDWDYEKNGRPDIVIMSYQGGDRSTIESRVGTFEPYDSTKGEYVDGSDWDAAVAAARKNAEPAKSSGSRSRKEPGGSARQADRAERRGVAQREHRPDGVADGLRREPLDDILDDAIRRAKLFSALRRAGAAEHEMPALVELALKRFKDRAAGLATREDPNCGTGAGGFQPGNTCAKGGDGGGPSTATAATAVDPPATTEASGPSAENCPAPCEMLAPVSDGGTLVISPSVDKVSIDSFNWNAAKHIDEDAAAAIRDYTGDEYDSINAHLRGGGDVDHFGDSSDDPFNGMEDDELIHNYGSSDVVTISNSSVLKELEEAQKSGMLESWENAEADVTEIYDNLRHGTLDKVPEFEPGAKYSNSDLRADKDTIVLAHATDNQIKSLNEASEATLTFKEATGEDNALDYREHLDHLVSVYSDYNKSGTYDEGAEYADHQTTLENAQQEYLTSGDAPARDSGKLRGIDFGLSSIASEANPLGKSFVTWRGSGSGTARIFEHIAVGDTFEDSGFLSTSASPRFAVEWKGADLKMLFRVVGKSGAPVDRISANKGEHEVMYPHATEFKVTNVARNVTVVKNNESGVSSEYAGITVVDIEEQ